MSASTPSRTFRLLTVNNVPERAKKVIGQVVEELKTRYRIEHVGNCFDKSEVVSKVKELKPDILCCASMWTEEESTEMRETAKSIIPGIKTYAIPQGLQVEGGPKAVVEHLKEQFPLLLDS
ncbi:hypothetical protein IWW34DRAFT_740095 [Fusarium oxysporum f. sp. albedinis]|nr:hypothetical protein IWW34DRAFT_740095 [Fusarium oxysporum f. sp. albedinis]KAJ0153777.1 hypothetical protein HZ326_3816 [Fusarium oxysporum f. sp. albedinis]KAK2474938.1 hypothetical protein H9L39_12531 [Fusarium oxysporum f. sp. albedinis]